MNHQLECPHCGAHHHLTAHNDFDGMCSCGNDVFELPYAPDEVGDISETIAGLEITTPQGHWEVTIEEALNLITGLSTMIHSRVKATSHE